MSNKENYKKAFSVLKSSCDFTLEEKRMNRIKRENTHRNLLVAAVAMLVVLVGSGTAYAADLGGIKKTVQMWVHGNKTDVSYEFDEEKNNYVKTYVNENGEEVQEDVSVWHGDNTPLEEDELIEYESDNVSYEKTDDGRFMIYYQNKAVDITDKFTDGTCYIHVVGEKGEKYIRIKLTENGDDYREMIDGPKPFVDYVDKKGVHHYEDVKLDENGNLSESTKEAYKRCFHKFIEAEE
ncbi:MULTISPECIES: hypothetical protein [Butyrivibrio]|uniref:hypothetical protein n=1 Tax=Butyrivibrio TaxID=830 RepID=UPI00040D6A78|nr:MULTISPECIES: hypothetical protein [Butyrivibrio]